MRFIKGSVKNIKIKRLSRVIALLVILFLVSGIAVFLYLDDGAAEEKSQEFDEVKYQSVENAPIDKEDLETISTEEEVESEEVDLEETEQAIAEDEAEESLETEAAEQEEEAKYSEKLTSRNIPVEEDEIRIGFITDLHLISKIEDGQRVFLDKYYERMDHFLRMMNDDFLPNLIIINGDVIEGTGRPAALGVAELGICRKFFDRTDIKKYWVVGNHDLRSVDKTSWENSLGIDYLRKKITVGDYDIFIVDSNFTENDGNVKPGRSYTRGNVSEEEMEWLEKELKKSSRKKLVFIHHPPLREVSGKPASNLLKNALDLQKIFSESDVLAVFSGHVEDLYEGEIDGVKYFVFPGIVKHPKYPGAFVEITARKSKLEIDMYYLRSEDREEYKKINID